MNISNKCLINNKDDLISYGATAYVYKKGDIAIKQLFYMNLEKGLREISTMETIKQQQNYYDLNKFKKTKTLGELKILPYGDFFHCEENKYFLIEMALFDGTLQDIFFDLKIDEIKKMYHDILHTLYLLRELGIYHDDISLTNIFYKKINDEYIFALGDFGRMSVEPRYSFYNFIKNIKKELIIANILNTMTFEQIMEFIEESNKSLWLSIKKNYEKEVEYFTTKIPHRPLELIEPAIKKQIIQGVIRGMKKEKLKELINYKILFSKSKEIMKFFKNIDYKLIGNL